MNFKVESMMLGCVNLYVLVSYWTCIEWGYDYVSYGKMNLNVETTSTQLANYFGCFTTLGQLATSTVFVALWQWLGHKLAESHAKVANQIVLTINPK